MTDCMMNSRKALLSMLSIRKDTYRIDDKEYTQPRHGFGKLVDFKLVGKTGDRLTFAFIDNEETFKNYPFHFNLAVSYRLAGNELHVIWHVENTDDKVIYFQIGGHPAFKVPGCKKGEKLKAITIPQVTDHPFTSG